MKIAESHSFETGKRPRLIFINTKLFYKSIEEKNGTIEERIEMAVSRCGMSITLTTTTDLIAFIVGSLGPFPAIKWFSLYAAAAIGFIYFYSLTLGVAFIALDEHREQSNKNNYQNLKTSDQRHKK